MDIDPLDSFAKFIRGDYFTGRMWKVTGVAVVIAFTMVYSSASMDQKVYRLKQLSEQKNALATEYVEIQSEISQVRMEDAMLEKFTGEGFHQAQEPASLIRIEKQ